MQLWFFALHIYSMRSIYLQSFLLIPLIFLELCPGQSSKCKINNNSKIKQGRITVLVHCTPTQYYIYLHNLKLISFVVSELCPRQEMKQWTNRQEICNRPTDRPPADFSILPKPLYVRNITNNIFFKINNFYIVSYV